MNLQKAFLVILILCSIHLCFGQKAQLVDEFGKTTNDPLQARVMMFLDNLEKNKTQGLIILYDEKDKSLARYLNERRIKGCFSWIKYDAANISFVFAERPKNVDYLFQFWEVSQNAKSPQFKTISHDYKLDDLTEPTMIYSNGYLDEYCPLQFDLEFYANFLRANPNITGKIVIYEKSAKIYNKERSKLIQELIQKEKISPKQIQISRVNSTQGIEYGTYYNEFWLIPKRTETAQRSRN